MYFDKIAFNWDNLSKQERAQALSDRIKEEVNDASKLTALDFGCGTGLIAFNLTDTFNEIYCTDLSKNMLEVLNNKLTESDNEKIKIIEINSLDSEIFAEKFNVVFSSMVFHHIVDIETELKRLYHLLKKDGIIIIIDLDVVDKRFHSDNGDFDGHHGFDRESLADSLKNIGFKNTSYKTVFSGKKKVDNDDINYSLFLIKGEK